MSGVSKQHPELREEPVGQTTSAKQKGLGDGKMEKFLIKFIN